MLETYTDSPILRIDAYFCLECAGLKKLPDQLILDPRVLRWCICAWPALQKDFVGALEHYAGQEEAEKAKGLWVVEQDQERDTA